ncbi:hypothetical protein FQN54_004584 [Arachnomyces sp. PD_36]|nr:hypothetical protein FQN54_004584 [Arachnomyces sp. PD_36]
MTLLKNAIIVATVLAAQGSNAWTFKWRDASGAVTNESGKEASPCKPIEHAEGEMFNWNAEGSDLCLYLYEDDSCKGSVAGTSCGPWNKESSRDLAGFMVGPDEDSTSSGDSTATATESGSATETPSTTETGTESGSASETGSATETGDSSSTQSNPTGTAPTESTVTENPTETVTDGPSDSGSPTSEAPTSTQTGAAATGGPMAGFVGALAAAAAVVAL